jgi:hypothetical protein
MASRFKIISFLLFYTFFKYEQALIPDVNTETTELYMVRYIP